MKFLLDTNVYIEASSSLESWKKFEQVVIPILPFVYFSAVVGFELGLSGQGRYEEELLDRHIEALTRVDRLITPDFQDWRKAISLIRKNIRSELCDVLIALSARKAGALLFTFDYKDYLPLSRHLNITIKKPW